MFKLSIPQVGDEILFEAILEPTGSAVDQLKKSEDIGEGEITTFHKKVNRAAVGVPYYENLISRFEEEKIPHEIEMMINDYDFHFISLSCSFLPDTDCKFVWARFGVELSTRSQSGELQENPIAYDMFPDEILNEAICKREVTFAPELKFSVGVINVGVKPIDASTEKKSIVYEPQIFAYGINRPRVAWDFKSTKEKGIWGNKKDLLLIVRAPKNSNVKGRFLLGAEIEVNIGKWVRIPLSKRNDKVVDVQYDLSE